MDKSQAFICNLKGHNLCAEWYGTSIGVSCDEHDKVMAHCGRCCYMFKAGVLVRDTRDQGYIICRNGEAVKDEFDLV